MDFKKKISEKGLKQRWIASKMGVSFEILNKWLNGKADFPESRQDELKGILN